MTARSRPAAVLIAALVVLSTVAGVAVVSAQDGTTTDTETATNATSSGIEIPPADDVYVKDGGDVILAYEEPSEDGRGNFGLDVNKGLFHMLAMGNLSEPSNATGNATAILTGNKFTGNGNLSVPRPEALSNLSVNVTGQRTDQNSSFDATAAATLTSGNSRTALGTAPTGLVEKARISGNITTTPSRFEVVAEAHVKPTLPLGPPQHREFHLSEQKGTYTLSASQNYIVSSFAAQQWSTRRQAEQTLRQRYVSIAERLGGSADLKIESYSFAQQRRGARLDIEYTVTYHGIERVLTNQLATRLSTSEKFDLNQSETDAITEQLRNLTVKEVSVRYDQQASSIDASMHVDLRNYEGAVFAALTAAESLDMQSLDTSAGFESRFTTQLQRIRDRFEARQAANLTTRYTFAANLSKKSSGTVAVNAELHYRTKNWATYVKELKERGIKPATLHYELHAATVNGRVNATVAIEVSRENLLRQASNGLLNLTRVNDGAAGPVPENVKTARKYIKAFRTSGFQKARMDVSMHDDRIRFEAGAAFENMTALRDALVATDQGTVQSVVGRTENGTVTSYVRVKGAVPADAGKSDVRNLPYVNDDTAIHMPNSWNKSFPTMNTTRAKNYLGLSESASSLMGPGFGIVVALVALLAAALVAARRRR